MQIIPFGELTANIFGSNTKIDRVTNKEAKAAAKATSAAAKAAKILTAEIDSGRRASAMTKALLEQMASAVKSQTALVKQVGAIFQFIIPDQEIKFYMDLKSGNGSAGFGEKAKPDCTITLSEADLLAIADGKLDGRQAFIGGRLKIKGNMLLAQKLAHSLAMIKKIAVGFVRSRLTNEQGGRRG